MRTTAIGVLGCLLGLASVVSLRAQAETIPEPEPPAWPGFRGAGGLAQAAGATPPLAWNAKSGENIVWRTEITRHGMSSPVVAGKRLFLTAADDLVRQLLCYDTETGKLLWNHDVDTVAIGDLPRVMEEAGFATPTPVTDGIHVAAVFATGELVCVNPDGDRVWIKSLEIPKNSYGHASSLIAHEGLLIVQYDQIEDSKLLAFDFASGKPAWNVSRDAASWSSPVLADNNGRMELILTNCKAVDSYDPRTGDHLWRVECLNGEVATSAAYANGVVFVANEGAPATAIDISKHDKDPKILWQWDEALPDAASPLAGNNHVIVPTAFGAVSCLDLKTGQVYWDHDFGKGFNSSPILVGDRVFIADMSGDTQIFRLGQEFQLIAAASVGEPVYATPAFVGNRVYVRGMRHLFCIEQNDYQTEISK